MKKSLILGTGIALAFSLVSCGGTVPDSLSSLTSGNSSSSAASGLQLPAYEADSALIFNEFAVGSSPISRAVELANIGTTSLDLSAYSIGIYKGTAQSLTYKIPLNGTLASGKTFVVVDSGSDADFISKADLLSPNLINNGTYPMVLLHGEKRVDVLGNPGFQTNWGGSCSLVRKNEFRYGAETFQANDYVAFTANNLAYLGVLDCPLSQTDLLAGPHLTQADLDAPYILNGQGGGGALPVSVAYYGDGDTTDFNYPDELNAMGYEDGHAFRYQNIDTPETQHGNYIQAQPWGYAAADFTNGILRNAKHLMVQSVKGGDLTETYGRLLGFVWYTNVSDPKPEDYVMVNHDIVEAGFSKIAFSGVATSQMNYRDLSYYAYLVDANNYAAKLGLKVHGETDPNFNY